MSKPEVDRAQPEPRPYRNLKEEPHYEEIRRLIDNLPPEKMERLKSYIKRWMKKI